MLVLMALVVLLEGTVPIVFHTVFPLMFFAVLSVGLQEGTMSVVLHSVFLLVFSAVLTLV